MKNLPATRETWVRSLGWEDPLEKGTAIHSSILPWRIPQTEEPGRLQSMGSQELDMAQQLSKKKSASWHCSKSGDRTMNKSKRKTLLSWNVHLSNGNQEIISAASLPPGPLARECLFPGGPQ